MTDPDPRQIYVTATMRSTAAPILWWLS